MTETTKTGEGTLRVMSPNHGDLSVTWDRSKADEIEKARGEFDEARGRGFAAYSMEAGGGRGTLIREFDPSADTIVLAPPISGG